MTSNPDDMRKYRGKHERHWDKVARAMDRWHGLGGGYHRRLKRIYRNLVPAGCRVLEVGCGTGDLLAAVAPSFGVGIDLSPEMLRRARTRHPKLHFVRTDVHELELSTTFDIIILSDLVNDIYDVQMALENLHACCHRRTRLIINTYSRLWEVPLKAASMLGLSKRRLRQNWLTRHDLSGLLSLADFDVVRGWQEVLWPLRTPLIDDFCNRFLVRIPPLNHLALTNFMVARSDMVPPDHHRPRVSVIVPARNESGNIRQILERTPVMGGGTELVFVEGNSKDDTYETIQKEIAEHPECRCQAMQQEGRGKGDAVRLGFERATGDILMILDADVTVAPEDLVRFYDALASGRCEFANGVRLVYPMEERAMRPANLMGNKFFSLAFSWLLGQPVKDTLCGTKVLWREDYEQVARNRSYFGEFDPFGDFDLLFGAARLNLKILDVPIRYHERTYGKTNISRWRHGVILLGMVFFGGRKLRFV